MGIALEEIADEVEVSSPPPIADERRTPWLPMLAAAAVVAGRRVGFAAGVVPTRTGNRPTRPVRHVADRPGRTTSSPPTAT